MKKTIPLLLLTIFSCLILADSKAVNCKMAQFSVNVTSIPERTPNCSIQDRNAFYLYRSLIEITPLHNKHQCSSLLCIFCESSTKKYNYISVHSLNEPINYNCSGKISFYNDSSGFTQNHAPSFITFLCTFLI